ncbi:efflux RND transporter permease subunit [Pseudalkalibacillus salsuginis]|uniref:efflux RND transporter permease subunit n=1 Tax=Pseudalkalibacillus salsuginis TaxID=2910972 RepID=UPI001F1F823B|nr:efflux RND transporter permease subunit [Pseudalkalibacillus salsuginis]MCF6409195.1 efflux RND transporter permease subunit [Pseudalkalibacillus salsuginis]
MKITELSVFRPIAMGMVILFMLIIGAVSVRNTPVDLFPDLTFPVAAVTVTYEGASPEEVEKLLSQPIENIMGTIPNVESVSSVSRTGGALIIVSYNWGTDMDFAALKMREQLDALREQLPNDVPQPRVLRFNPNDLPIVRLGIQAPEGDLVAAKKLVENEIKPVLDSIDGVASVTIEGGTEKVVNLAVDPENLNDFGITINQLRQILAGENVTLPSGEISDKGLKYPLRVVGEFDSITDLKQLPIPTKSGVVALEQLVEIEETIADADQISYMNGEPSIGISILKQSGENTVTVANSVEKKLDELSLTEDVEVETIFNQAKFIKQSIKAVLINMVIGSLLAAGILYLFLRNIRSTLIVGFSIPISVMTAFIFMYFSGQTLNLLTLGGLALGVGMIVDNSIVILESIYRLREKGVPLKEAAITGTKEVGGAVIASTLTTVVVFLPIIFVDGLAAQLFKPLALSVSYALVASLITSLIIVPLLSSNLLTRKHKLHPQNGKFLNIRRRYVYLLRKALRYPKRVIIGTFVLLLISLSAIPFIGTEFLPAQDQSYVNIEVELPPGSDTDTTYRTTETINERLDDIQDIDLYYVTIGGSNDFSIQAGSNSNTAMYSILLKPVSERGRSDVQVAEAIRTKVDKIKDADISVQASDAGFSESPVSLEVSGPDLGTLETISENIKEEISKVDGIREIESNYETGNPQLEIEVDRTKASSFGLTSAQVSQAVENATKGRVATVFNRSGDQVDVRVQVDPAELEDVKDLEHLQIESPAGELVTLKSIAEIKQGTGPSQINRTDRLREIRVTASILDRDLGNVIDDVKKQLKENVSLPSGYEISFGGQNQQMKDAFFKLTGALALAVVLIYMVMAGQFESFSYPFIIMFSIPLTAIGILLGLLITRQPFGVGSLVGILILTGIIVNNAIVLVDYINQLKKRGLSTARSIVKAGEARLRPIMMTALTTILGLVPLMVGIGEGTEIQQPMAIVIVFGLLFGTMISLIFIPVIYNQFDRIKEKRRLKKAKSKDMPSI